MVDQTGRSKHFPEHFCELPPPVERTLPPPQPDATAAQRAKRLLVLPLFLPWQRHRGFRMMRRSNYSRDFEQARQAHAARWWVIHPFSKFALGWQAFMMPVLFLSVFVKLFLLCFVQTNSAAGEVCPVTDPYIVEVTMIADIFFGFNILIKFNTGYIQSQNNVVIMKRSLIAGRYFRSWFIPDILSTVPAQKFFYYVVQNNDVHFNLFSTVPYKIIRVTISIYLITVALRIFEFVKNVKDWAQQIGVPEYKFRLIKLIILYITFHHCMACAHFAVPILVNGNFTLQRRSYSWLSETNATNTLCKDNFLHYVMSFQRTLSFITGFGYRMPRNWCDITLFLINAWVGAGLFAYAVALCLNIMQVRNRSQIHYEKTIQELEMYMRAKKMPLRKQRRMLTYCQYRLQKRYFDENAILWSLPAALRNDIKMYCCRRLVSQAAMFQGLPKSLVLAIVRELQEVVFLREDVVYSAGSQGNCMYFVSCGTLMVMLPSGEEVGHLADGCHFGEIEMLGGHIGRTTSVVALETCELYRLHRVSYRRLIAPLPGLHTRVRSLAQSEEERLLTMAERLPGLRTRTLGEQSVESALSPF